MDKKMQEHWFYFWEDMNKFSHPKNVASSGGVVCCHGFCPWCSILCCYKKLLFTEEMELT